MSDQVFKYRGQIGSVEFDFDDDCLHGKLLYINDLVTYEAESIRELREEFHAAVDDYLETCEELGQEPNKPFKGSFNVRVGEELHRRLAIHATVEGKSLNEACVEAIELYLDGAFGKVVEHVHNHTHTHTYRQAEHFAFEGADVATDEWLVEGVSGQLRVVGGH